MKKNIIAKGIVGMMAAALLGSCSSDYLDLKPITAVSTNTVTSTPQVAEATYYGILEYMYTQISAGQPPYFTCNGEPWLNMFYGEAAGQDHLSYIYGYMGIYNYITNWDGMEHNDYWMCRPGWMYSYTLINAANQFLVGIDDCECANDTERAQVAYMKAGALAIRAHAYVKLIQIYGPRWEDSNNGQELVCVLRLKPSTDGLPLVSYKEVMDQIYKDLDESIALFENEAAGLNRGSALWEVDVHVAKGIYARACMINHDFQKAQKMAHEARQGFDIMTQEQCLEGFCYANQEYMWTNIHDDFVYYWAHGSAYACNGAYPVQWANIGAGSINYDLYKQIPEKDVRRKYYWTPDKPLFRGVTKASFWNKKVINETDMDLHGLNTSMITSINSYGDAMRPNEAWPKAYTSDKLGAGEHIMVPFGAQYKFWGSDEYGTNQFPFMRASEMLLTEAEAAYENGDMATAKSCLEELNAKRNPDYTCTATGEALRDEVRLYRRIELWGEGHNWFDFKRWNITLERKPWIEGDQNSNNFPARFCITKDPSANNGWRYAIPRAESDYNEVLKKQLNKTTTPAEKPE